MKADIEDMNTYIIAYLHKRGYKVNEYRKIIVDHVCDRDTVDDVEHLWLDIKKKCDISYAALYANMRLLVKEHVLIKEERSGHKNKYTINTRFLQTLISLGTSLGIAGGL